MLRRMIGRSPVWSRSARLLLSTVCVTAAGCSTPEKKPETTEFAAWKASLTDQRPVERDDISGIVRGCSGRHRVIVRLQDAKTFGNDKEIGRVSFEPLAVRGGGIFFAFEVPPGEYAISAFEDENSNGRPDRGWFGQHEPIGYYRSVPVWWTPFFNDVKFKVAGTVSGIEIELH